MAALAPGITPEAGRPAKEPATEPLPCRFCPAERVSVPSTRLLAATLAPAAMFMLVEPAMAPLPDNATVPALISVLPVQVFTPVSVRVLVLFLVKLPFPETALARSTSLVWLKIIAPLLVTVPAGKLPLE